MGRSRDAVIEDLKVALRAAGYSMASASKALDLNHSYLSKFMRKKDYSPEALPEDVRIALAQLIGLGEEKLRIDTHRSVDIKKSEGIKGYGKDAPKTESDRRNAHMRIDNLLIEVGRIKERLDKLEGQPGSDQAEDKAKPATRP
jgi:hypothetical protein